MSHSSVFHAGVIGRGPRIASSSSCLTPSQVSHNETLLLSLLAVICSGEAMGLALYLVEIISPDVMYNGLPWLEEEFCKVEQNIGCEIYILTPDNLRNQKWRRKIFTKVSELIFNVKVTAPPPLLGQQGRPSILKV